MKSALLLKQILLKGNSSPLPALNMLLHDRWRQISDEFSICRNETTVESYRQPKVRRVLKRALGLVCKGESFEQGRPCGLMINYGVIEKDLQGFQGFWSAQRSSTITLSACEYVPEFLLQECGRMQDYLVGQ